ncbi:hypothetical protein D9758_013349 [Tetrapyrgos nigripes]|uniref:Uncharacterized protein n=1 Tax=Tetrapyrgos nigripes TaxID=182062 RepID=A0A8H5FN28_9AGAR|nr:hypothetical protein D9758_013349 [Tetrapyrgos nigripes]
MPIAMVLRIIKGRNPEDSKDGMLVFENPPDSVAWGRFRIYSERVREFVLDFRNYLPLLETMVGIRPASSLILFPKLCRLKVIVEDEYPGCVEILVEFFHQQVDSFIYEIHEYDETKTSKTSRLISLFTSIFKGAGNLPFNLTLTQALG